MTNKLTITSGDLREASRISGIDPDHWNYVSTEKGFSIRKGVMSVGILIFEEHAKFLIEMLNGNSQELFPKWPSHEGSLCLTHNDHKAAYETVAQSVENAMHGYTDECWVSAEQKKKAIETNDCWTLQWYPDSPNGFCLQSASDLNALLKMCEK